MRPVKDGLKFYAYVIKSGFTPTIFTSNQLIHLYAKHGLVHEAQKLFDEMPDKNVFTWNAIIKGHVKARNLKQAKCIFAAAPCRDSVTYNSMLSGYVNSDGYEKQSFELFLEMHYERGEAKIDEFSFTTMLNLTAKVGVIEYGRQLHCFMVKTANDLSGFAISSLVDMYSKCGCFSDSWRVFDGCEFGLTDLASKNAMVAACCRAGEMEMASNLFWSKPELNDHVSWNTMISGYAQNGYDEDAVGLFKSMANTGYRWNEYSFASVLSACSGLKSLKLGKEVHAWVLKAGMIGNPYVNSGIVDVYCKCGNMKYADLVNMTIGVENSFAITSMIVGYSTMGKMVEARKLFDSLAEKNYVVWTAMISGYVKSHQSEDVFKLFRECIKQNNAIAPDALILVNLLGACALRAIVDPGKQIHAYLLRTGYKMDEKMGSAMVDMYSKCGTINYAERIFQRVIEKDSVLYNIMIAGYAHHGYEYESIHLFEEMKEKGIRPDVVTFIAILSACRHSGLVELGEKYFSSMTEEYSISPETDHYACMIDLYGRANQLEKAIAFMGKIPIEADGVILGTFLNACKMNKNVELARAVEEKLLKIEGNSGARYVQLASVYASKGKWDEMGRIMKKMRGNTLKKLAGCSWLHVGDRVHTFVSGDTSHLETEAMYSILRFLIQELDDIAQTRIGGLIES